MSSISSVVILLVLTSVSLLIVSLINRRQTRQRLINQKLLQLKRRFTELEELSVSIESLVEFPQISRIIMEEAVDMARSMIQMAPEIEHYRLYRHSAEKRCQALSSASHHQAPLSRLMESDSAIARSQYCLSETARIVKKRHAAGLLQHNEAEMYLRDLSWASTMVEIVSNVAQGHNVISHNDTLKAAAYYRKALDAASQSNSQDERQATLMRELQELVGNQRKTLSKTLMPEAHRAQEQKELGE